MRVRKNIYYFPTSQAAHDYAVEHNWPVDRIVNYQLGWAIQLRVSGPYVGPSSDGERRHDALMSKRRA